MNIHKHHNVIWGLILVVLSTIVCADLRYVFGNYDTPFYITCGLYVLAVIFLRSTSRLTMSIVVLLIVSMAFFYMLYGPVRITERIGEWFFLFFFIGLVQYIFESFFRPKF